MAFDHAFKGIHCLFPPRRFLECIRHDAFYALLHKSTDGLEDLGDPALGCNWITLTKGFGPETIVYSAGVGKDISFEHALVDRYGVTIQLLDPSPTALKTMAKPANQRPQLQFHKYALAGYSGELILNPPGNPEEGSWATCLENIQSTPSTSGHVVVPCVTVADLMKRLGHTYIDLLKIDIEGAEYGVIESILESGVVIRQIAVEYHNGILPGISRGKTIKSLLALRRAGYRIVYKGGGNHTLCLAKNL